MGASQIRNCYNGVIRLENEMNGHRVEGQLYYTNYKTLHNYYNDGLMAIEERRLTKTRKIATELTASLTELISNLNECQSDIQKVSFYKDLSQLLKDSKMFDSSPNYETAIDSIMESIKALQSDISGLIGLCQSRKQICEMTLQQIDIATNYILESRNKLNVCYINQKESYAQYVMGVETWNNNHDDDQISPLSFESWWNIHPYTV